MDVSRNKWATVRVTAIKSDQKGLARSVYLKIGDRPGIENAKNIVKRPVDNVVLFLESDMFDPYLRAN